jgi:hypothetical protein
VVAVDPFITTHTLSVPVTEKLSNLIADEDWFLPESSNTKVYTEVLTVDDVSSIHTLEYDIEDGADGSVISVVWDATAFNYRVSSYYGDNATDDTHPESRDGFYNIFVKRSPTEFHILALKNSTFHRIRKVKINGKNVKELTLSEYVAREVPKYIDSPTPAPSV